MIPPDDYQTWLLSLCRWVEPTTHEPPVAAPLSLGGPWFLGAGFLALALMMAHLLAQQMRLRLSRYSAIVGSFGGGMASAYVFIHLIPELHKGEARFGVLFFAVPLVGFTLTYLIHYLNRNRAGADAAEDSKIFRQRLASLCTYNFLVVYGTPALEVELGWHSVTITIALVLHLMHADFSFGHEYPRHFDSKGRYALMVFSFLGWLVLVFERRTHADLTTFLMALLAGSILFNVFHEEIPDERESIIGWFIAGIVLFTSFALFSAY